MLLFLRKRSNVLIIFIWPAWDGHELILQLSHHSNLHNTQGTVLHASTFLTLSVRGPLVTKFEYFINSCKGEVYVLGAKIKQNFLKYKLSFKKMEYFGIFMKNKTSLLVSYNENKPCADYAKRNWRGGAENKEFN